MSRTGCVAYSRLRRWRWRCKKWQLINLTFYPTPALPNLGREPRLDSKASAPPPAWWRLGGGGGWEGVEAASFLERWLRCLPLPLCSTCLIAVPRGFPLTGRSWLGFHSSLFYFNQESASLSRGGREVGGEGQTITAGRFADQPLRWAARHQAPRHRRSFPARSAPPDRARRGALQPVKRQRRV